MATFFEMMMLVCFGAAWPASIYKSWKSRSTGAKSLLFLIIVEVGYICGMLFKITGQMNYVFFLYLMNFCMVLTDILLYIRNHKLQKSAQQADNQVETAQVISAE